MLPETPRGGGDRLTISDVASPAPSFYRRSTDGRHLVCLICQQRDGRHDPACALVVLRVQVQEITTQLAMFVAAVRETLDLVERLVCGDGFPKEWDR